MRSGIYLKYQSKNTINNLLKCDIKKKNKTEIKKCTEKRKKNFPKNSRKFFRIFWKNRIRVRFFKYHFCKKLIKSFYYNQQPAIPHRERSEPSAHAPLTVPAEQNSGVSKGLRSDKKTAFGTA